MQLKINLLLVVIALATISASGAPKGRLGAQWGAFQERQKECLLAMEEFTRDLTEDDSKLDAYWDSLCAAQKRKKRCKLSADIIEEDLQKRYLACLGKENV